jgi:hypothetical protein
MLNRFDRLRPVEFGLDENGYERLREHVARWRLRTLEIGERAPERDLDGPDLGLGL